MAKLTILRGVSGSGKSTWASQQNAVIVSRDAIRLAFFGSNDQDYYAVDKDVLTEKENTVTVLQDAVIAGALKSGRDVVVDNTNTEWKFVKSIAKIGYRYGAEVEVKTFDVPLIVAKMRIAGRAKAGGRHVADRIVESQYERLQKTKNMELPVLPAVKPYTGTPGKPKAFLVDIDGTLAHMSDKRGPFDWAKVGVDDPDEVVIQIVRSLFMDNDENYTVIVMSGRDESCRAETAKWLDLNGVPWNHLFMRPEKDMRPDNIIKAELFDQNVRDNFDVQFVLDDRDQVVEMWRRMGLTCLQVAEGNF